MARDSGVRRRGEVVSEKDTKNSDNSESEKKAAPDKASMMRRWCPRLFYSYRVLILFSLVVCILQILVGISFFSTFSHRTGDKSVPSKTQPSTVKAQLLPEPQISPSSATGLSFPCNITGKEAVSAINRATTKACKQEMVDLVCSLEKGTVYPTHLKRTCPHELPSDGDTAVQTSCTTSVQLRMSQKSEDKKLRLLSQPTSPTHEQLSCENQGIWSHRTTDEKGGDIITVQQHRAVYHQW